jgi:hypothetical protein
MRADGPRANTEAMNGAETGKEDPMDSTSTFFIETACVTGISPLGIAAADRLPHARWTSGRRQPPVASVTAERFIEELLATFSDRWEW